jgi:8-oxo-dGTP pyrophosphatase MutT (NUDIX family)
MSDAGSDRVERLNGFIKRMNESDRDLRYDTIRPRDAATLILIDRSGAVPKVLLGKRHAGHVFLPGKFVFPGGAVEPGDKLMPAARPLDPRAETRLMRHFHKASPARARALALAAIRETCEETGLLLGTRGTAAKVPDGHWAPFAEHHVLPELGVIHFIGRAITPPGRSRRFDARFFTMDASEVAHRIEGVIGPESELIELVWMPLTEAKEIDILAITGVMLEELDARIANGLGHDLPVPFYRMLHGKFLRELL